MPHTPFPPTRQPSHNTTPRALDTSSLPLRTPYTPYTAFASKQNPFDMGFEAGGISAAHAHLLDDSDDPLAGLFNQILKFVERDLKRIMELGEKVCVKPSMGQSHSKGQLFGLGSLTTTRPSTQNSGEKENKFDIMANVVWTEFGKAIMEELGHVVFAVGKPDEFRKVYNSTSFPCPLANLH